MSKKAHGQLRRSQVITTFGPGALIDLPNDSAIVGGLDTWGSESGLQRIDEPRLSAKLMSMTRVPNPNLYAPPPEPDPWQDKQRGIGGWRFPEWFVVQEAGHGSETRLSSRSRRIVGRTALNRGRYDRIPVVATRFVRACSKGHVDDIDWYRFVHGTDDPCRRQLWARRARHQRRSRGAARALRVRQVAAHARGGVPRGFPARHVQRSQALAGTQCK